MAASALEEFRRYLRIDADALDGCLTEQPDLYYHVAERYARVWAERDAAKLDVDELSAELDQEIRAEALEKDVKITEAQLQNKIRTTPSMKKVVRQLAELRTEADAWAAMKEAFQQRSFMLRELVSLQISQLRELSLERNVPADRARLGDVASARVQEARSGGEERR